MKNWRFILLMVIFSCNDDQQPKVDSTDKLVSDNSASIIQKQEVNEISWTGTLNNKTPIFLHYKLENDLVIGEITYLNTKDKLPIRIIGTIHENNTYKLLEFENNGNITGIITGVPTGNAFNGNWFSPKTRKELTVNLVKKDTTINSVETNVDLADIFGSYYYQFSDEGYQGGFDIIKLPGSKAIFGASCVTGAPARNLAFIEDDTISLNTTQFVYNIPDSDDCEFSVKFYKGFAYIKYTKGFCKGQFGHNATIDGIFIKMK